MRVFLAATEYVETPGVLGFEVREVHQETAQLLAYDLQNEDVVGLLSVGYTECEDGLASLLPVGEKEYVVQGASRDDANYLTFRITAAEWSPSYTITCQAGSQVEYSPRLTLRYHLTTTSGDIVLTLYDPFAGIEIEEVALTPEDQDSYTVVISEVAGQKLAFQGQSLKEGVLQFRITPVTFPPLDSESKCNCNR